MQDQKKRVRPRLVQRKVALAQQKEEEAAQARENQLARELCKSKQLPWLLNPRIHATLDPPFKEIILFCGSCDQLIFNNTGTLLILNII